VHYRQRLKKKPPEAGYFPTRTTPDPWLLPGTGPPMDLLLVGLVIGRGRDGSVVVEESIVAESVDSSVTAAARSCW